MYCKKCHKEIREKDNYCPNCGAKNKDNKKDQSDKEKIDMERRRNAPCSPLMDLWF